MHRQIERAKFLSPLAGGTGEKSFLELTRNGITGAADAHGGGPVTGKLRTSPSCDAAGHSGPQASLR
jgi:hypothetical protein